LHSNNPSDYTTADTSRKTETGAAEILKSISDPLFTLDSQGRFTFVNTPAAVFLDATPETLIGQVIWEEYAGWVSRDGYSAYQSAIETQTSLEFEDYSISLNRWFENRVYPQQGGITVILQDISERKRLEYDFATALQEALERADHDLLTGLLNSRALYKRLQEEAMRCRRDDRSLAVALLNIDQFKPFYDAYGSAVGDEVLRRLAERLNQICRSYDVTARTDIDEFCVVISDTSQLDARSIETRLMGEIGALTYTHEGSAVPITVAVAAAVLSPGSHDCRGLLQRAGERMKLIKSGVHFPDPVEDPRYSEATHVDGFGMLDQIVTAVDNKDRYTRRHSEDVMMFSLMMAEDLGLDEEAKRTLTIAALLHDVGKIGIPDAVLRKPALLTEVEFAAIKQHPSIGGLIVSVVPGLEAVAKTIECHHERWDGRGYPNGLAGDNIPFIARVLSVANAFSAMTTDRPYRKAMSRERALSTLLEGAGAQWDDHCVDALLRIMQI